MTTSQQRAARRKKRTAKHVLKANEKRELDHQQQQTARLSSTEHEEPNKAPSSTKGGKKKRRQKHHIKDPNEAARYLSSWKHRNAGGAWKFNKNTQSWLIRHMYQPEKVPKGTFTTLLEYIDGLQGQMKTRTVADAERRALRYKDHEKRNPDESCAKDSDKKEEDMKMDGNEKKEEDATQPPDSRVANDDDAARWKTLDSHGRRKEYKRARKVLDVLK